MLPDVAAEMVHFLSRRDLDKASGVSKWLDRMIAQCEVYPLRPFGDYYRPIALSPDQWATLIDALRSAAVRHLGFDNVDLNALYDDAFRVAVECRGLLSFEVQRCVILSGFVTDELIRSSVAKDYSELSLWGNKSDSPHRISKAAIMDCLLPADALPEQTSLSLVLKGTGITETFLAKIFEADTFLEN
ncbi:hypothetical protein AAVH_25028 [Aphelenchoides avenae]|nr:hypothetical protein AAVH_25028 [Aphelenchus avenae]